MAPNCGFQSEYWTSRWGDKRITEVLLWPLGHLHACIKPSSVQHKAPWHSTSVWSPLPLLTHLSPPPVSPTEAEWDLLQKDGSWAWLSSGTPSNTAQGWAAPAPLHRCSGGKAVGVPCYPHVSREAGKLVSRAYKQHSLGNYAPTGIYYLETMSGIKLPGKIRLQSK